MAGSNLAFTLKLNEPLSLGSAFRCAFVGRRVDPELSVSSGEPAPWHNLSRWQPNG